MANSPHTSRRMPFDPKTDVPPEAAVLLALAGADAHLPDTTGEALGAVRDWDRLTQAARRHRLTGLLAAAVAGRFAEMVPEGFAARCRSIQERGCLRSLAAAHDLSHVLTLLHAAGVTALPYKGVVLAARAYGDIGCREPVDHDLLVARKDVDRAAQALMAAGYAPVEHLPRTVARAVRRGECEEGFLGRGRLAVEIHWQVLPSSFGTPMPAEPLLATPHTVKLTDDVSVAGLSLEDELIAACVHGYKHSWRHLETIAGVTRLVGRSPGDGSALLRRAGRLRARRRTVLGIAVAHRVADAAMPPAVAYALQHDRAIREMAGRVATVLLMRIGGEAAGCDDGRDATNDLTTVDTPADSLRCLVAKLLYPRNEDLAWLTLPAASSSLYPVVRPMRLAWTALTAARDRRMRA